MPEYVITLSGDWRVKEGHAVSWLSVYSICLAWFLAYIARSFRDFPLETLKETVICSKIRRELIHQRKIKSSSVNKCAHWSSLQEQQTHGNLQHCKGLLPVRFLFVFLIDPLSCAVWWEGVLIRISGEGLLPLL